MTYVPYGLSEIDTIERCCGFDLREAPHPERVGQAKKSGNGGDQQRDLVEMYSSPCSLNAIAAELSWSIDTERAGVPFTIGGGRVMPEQHVGGAACRGYRPRSRSRRSG